jgi:hypothetical protein
MTSFFQQLFEKCIDTKSVCDIARLEEVVPVLAVKDAQRRVVCDVVWHVLRLVDGLTIFFVLRTHAMRELKVYFLQGKAAHRIVLASEDEDPFSCLPEDVAHAHLRFDLAQLEVAAEPCRIGYCTEGTSL